MACCVLGCKNRYATTSQVTFYTIPTGTERFQRHQRRLWLEAIARANNKADDPRARKRICSAHFISGEASMDHDSPDFVPSVFPSMNIQQDTKKKFSRHKKRGRPRKVVEVESERSPARVGSPVACESSVPMETQSTEETQSPSTTSIPTENEPLDEDPETHNGIVQSQKTSISNNDSVPPKAPPGFREVYKRPVLCLKPLVTPKGYYSCDVCNRNFTDIPELIKHRCGDNDNKTFLCETCGQNFLTPSSCDKHQNDLERNPREEFFLPCNMCERTFRTQGDLKRHKLLHVRDGRKCRVCGVMFCRRHRQIWFQPMIASQNECESLITLQQNIDDTMPWSSLQDNAESSQSASVVNNSKIAFTSTPVSTTTGQISSTAPTTTGQMSSTAPTANGQMSSTAPTVTGHTVLSLPSTAGQAVWTAPTTTHPTVLAVPTSIGHTVSTVPLTTGQMLPKAAHSLQNKVSPRPYFFLKILKNIPTPVLSKPCPTSVTNPPVLPSPGVSSQLKPFPPPCSINSQARSPMFTATGQSVSSVPSTTDKADSHQPLIAESLQHNRNVSHQSIYLKILPVAPSQGNPSQFKICPPAPAKAGLADSDAPGTAGLVDSPGNAKAGLANSDAPGPAGLADSSRPLKAVPLQHNKKGSHQPIYFKIFQNGTANVLLKPCPTSADVLPVLPSPSNPSRFKIFPPAPTMAGLTDSAEPAVTGVEDSTVRAADGLEDSAAHMVAGLEDSVALTTAGLEDSAAPTAAGLGDLVAPTTAGLGDPVAPTTAGLGYPIAPTTAGLEDSPALRKVTASKKKHPLQSIRSKVPPPVLPEPSSQLRTCPPHSGTRRIHPLPSQLPEFTSSLKMFSPQYLTSAFLDVDRNYGCIFSNKKKVKKKLCQAKPVVQYKQERTAYDIDIVL